MSSGNWIQCFNRLINPKFESVSDVGCVFYFFLRRRFSLLDLFLSVVVGAPKGTTISFQWTECKRLRGESTSHFRFWWCFRTLFKSFLVRKGTARCWMLFFVTTNDHHPQTDSYVYVRLKTILIAIFIHSNAYYCLYCFHTKIPWRKTIHLDVRNHQPWNSCENIIWRWLFPFGGRRERETEIIMSYFMFYR